MAEAEKKPAAKRAPRKTTPPRKAKEVNRVSNADREKIIAEYAAEQEQAQAEAKQTRYVRNRSGAPFRMKLSRHTSGQAGIALKPRGERGDIAPLEPGDLEDIIVRDNAQLGLIEIITEAEALGAMGKQTTNQQAVHPALAALRNSQGEEGMTLAPMQQSFEEQGITVAKLEDGQIAFEKDGLGRDTSNIKRQPGESPGVPANIPGAEPGHSPANEAPSFLSDLRSKTTVNPPEKS